MSNRSSFRVLLELLDAAGARRVALAAVSQLVERLSITASTLLVVSGRPDAPVAVFVGLSVVYLFRSATRARLGVYVRAQVLRRLTRAILRSPSVATEAVTVETELSLVDGMYAAEDVLRQRVPELLGDAVACVLLAAFVAWRESWLFLIESLATVVVGGVALLLVRRQTARVVERAWSAFLPALDDLLTAIYARVEIVGNGDDARLLGELDTKLRDWKRQTTGAGVASFFAGRAPLVAAGAVFGVVLLRTTGLRGLSLGSVAVLASVVPPFAGVSRVTLDFARDLARVSPVVAVLEAARSPHAVRPTRPNTVKFPCAIAWENLSFAYPGQTARTLDAVSLAWQPGELLALAGQNGSGKSTLVRMLLGLHVPTGGRVTLGETPLLDMDLSKVRGQLGYLAQRPFLPERATVAEAVRLLAPDATADATQAVLTRLALFPVLVRRNPTAPLEVKLGALSAGEKQRVAIARVLLRNAPVLLLDEPDANLDAEGVALVGTMLREEASSRMVLFVAHSPALLACADRVIHFDAGRGREVEGVA